MKMMTTLMAVALSFATPLHAADQAYTLVNHYASKMGVPRNVAIAVAKVESGMRCHVGGKYIGPLQIGYQSARGLGFKGTRQQLKRSCDLQVRFGMKHLAAGLRAAKGNIRRGICKHQAGIFSRCSGNNGYTRKVMRHM